MITREKNTILMLLWYFLLISKQRNMFKFIQFSNLKHYLSVPLTKLNKTFI